MKDKIKSFKVKGQAKLKLTHINFVILHRHVPCSSYIFKIDQKHLFLCGKRAKLKIAVLAFFKQKIVTIK